jgi:hypothetical protein
VGRQVPQLTESYRRFAGVNQNPTPGDTMAEVSMEGAFNLVDQGNSRLDAWSRTLQTFGAGEALNAFTQLQNSDIARR